MQGVIKKYYPKVWRFLHEPLALSFHSKETSITFATEFRSTQEDTMIQRILFAYKREERHDALLHAEMIKDIHKPKYIIACRSEKRHYE